MTEKRETIGGDLVFIFLNSRDKKKEGLKGGR